jgi:hypothetical protein
MMKAIRKGFKMLPASLVVEMMTGEAPVLTQFASSI